MTIAVIGPVPPFRSGVAKHTGALAKALTAHGPVRTISFSRQYPGLLFPGDGDRDPAAAAMPEDTEFNLDTLDPLSWRRCMKAIDGASLAVIPAWTFFTAPCLTAIAARLRSKGTRVISVVHNAADHDSAPWKRMLLRQQIRASDAAVTHNEALAVTVRAIAPGLPVSVSPHPLFDYPKPTGALKRRAALELLMFGLVRPYKGADILIDAMALCADLDVRLSIVGEVWGDGQALAGQVARLGLQDRVELVSRYVSDAEAAEYFGRADALVLPYRSVTGSGVAALATAYGRPVIASDLPGFREAVQPGKTGWLFEAGNAGALARSIHTLANLGDTASMDASIARVREGLGWDRFANTVVGQMPLPERGDPDTDHYALSL